jgi:hypothetical protein
VAGAVASGLSTIGTRRPLGSAVAARAGRRNRNAPSQEADFARDRPRLGLPLSNVGGVLRRLGLGRLKSLHPPAPVVRYARARPGELVHSDTKSSARLPASATASPAAASAWSTASAASAGEYLHVAVDDASRMAYTELLPEERKASAIAFLERALARVRPPLA